MRSSFLTSFLLDASLVQYTKRVVVDALRTQDPVLRDYKKPRAVRAVGFFLDILDCNVNEEKEYLDKFRRYNEALNDSGSILEDPETLYDFSESHWEPFSSQTSNLPMASSATQHVLSLPDTLNIIFSNIPVLTKEDRITICNASLTSRAFYNAAKYQLWSHPRDLNTFEQQVRFAFGIVISGVGAESLGNLVKRLRIRIDRDFWVARLIQKIANLTPNVMDLLLHWGDSSDGSDVRIPVEQVTYIHNILSAFPNLKYLSLIKFTFTSGSEIVTDIQSSSDAHLPFTMLETIQLYDFHWYWNPISTGLGSQLKSLTIGFGTRVHGGQIIELISKLPSLKTLSITSSNFHLTHVRSLVKMVPGLESINLTNFSVVEEDYSVEIIPLLVNLRGLREIDLNAAVAVAQLDTIAASSLPMESLSLTLESSSWAENSQKTLIKLINSKRETLKNIFIVFYPHRHTPIVPSDEIVEALARVPQLEHIEIDFNFESLTFEHLSTSSVETLLRKCPHLQLTDCLQDLVGGNELYHREFKDKLEKEQSQQVSEWRENVLGN